MAASSEIRFKIGADTSALSSAFTKAQTIAATAGAQIHKKFSFKDAFKGFMTGIGINSVDAIADIIVRPFQLGMERAKDMLNLTTRLRDLTVQEIVAGGGRKTAIDAMKKEVKDLDRDIQDQANLVKSLDTPVAKINPMAANLLREAEQELVNLKVRQAEVQSKITTELAATKRATSEWAREQSTLMSIADAELRDAGQREKLQIRLNALQREYARLIKRGDAGTDKERNNVAQQFAIQNQIRLLNKAANEERDAALVSLGGQLAGKDPSRVRTPTRTGRSERERIADRGKQRMAEADDAIRTGRSPGFVASLVKQGNEDLTAAGKKVREATAKVAESDAKKVGDELFKANQTLRNIEKNLTPSKVR